MNKTKSLLLLVSLLTSCLLIFSPKATGQKDGQVTPKAVTFPPRDLRKAIALGPASVLKPYAVPEEQDLRGPDPSKNLPSNIFILRNTATGYVRLWVDWAVLQPSRSSTNTIRTNPMTKPLIESLDQQIIAARNDGLRVILTIHQQYPTWVVWHSGNKPPSGTCADKKNEEICKRVPEELDENSPWGRFISFLVREYGFTKDKTNSSSADYHRYVDFLEIVNEPNLTHRTQQKRHGDRLVIALNVAEMFETAQTIVSKRNASLRPVQLDAGATTIKLAGPATADTLKNDKKLTSYQEFTEELLLALKRRDFRAGGGFVWSHHNYKDMEEQRNCAPGDSRCKRTPHCFDYDTEKLQQRVLSKINSAAWVENKLDAGFGGYRWRGMRDKDDNPAIFLTEGGVRLDQVVNIYWCYLGLPQPVDPNDPNYPAFVQAVKEKMNDIKAWQAGFVGKSFDLMSQGSLSKGILLFTNYLTYTDPTNDTGMFNFVGTCAEWESDPRNAGFICSGENGLPPRPLYDRWQLLRTP